MIFSPTVSRWWPALSLSALLLAQAPTLSLPAPEVSLTEVRRTGSQAGSRGQVLARGARGMPSQSEDLGYRLEGGG
jgi:hypothetical protein